MRKLNYISKQLDSLPKKNKKYGVTSRGEHFENRV